MATDSGYPRPSRLGDVIRPPVQRHEFWLIQALLVLVAVLHAWLEYRHVLDGHSPVYLFPATLFLIPIAYAALTFGAYGALASGAIAVILTLPNLWLWHPGLSSLGEMAQVVWIILVGWFVGVRVDRERAARAQAERSRDQVRTSEARYRSILQNIADPLLVLDHERRVVAANDAAATFMGLSLDGLIGLHLTGPVGSTIVRALPHLDPGGAPVRRRLGPRGRWYDVSALETDSDGHGTGLQLLLIDVTAQQERMVQLEELTRETLTAREEERLRLARELHDGPLQSVMAVHRSLASLIDHPRTDALDALSQAQMLAQTAADELRQVSRALRPPILDDLGAVAAIEAEAMAFQRRSGIATVVAVASDASGRRLSPEREIALLRICQEALRNVERHAHASGATLSIDVPHDADFRVRIEDDGVGMDVAQDRLTLVARGHLGLIGMEERVRAVGGTLSVERLPDAGTRVEVLLPRVRDATVTTQAERGTMHLDKMRP